MDFFAKLWDRISDFAVEYIAKPISKIGVLDVIDILLLAVLLFVIYRFFKDRRAGRVLLGLALIVVASVVVSAFNLPALSYIVKLFAAAAFFCIVVIFQPEFRDALESIGNIKFLNPRSGSISRKRLPLAQKAVDETVDAIFKMASTKTGALIVFEGLTKLGDYTRTGQLIDSEISSKLLQNIFYGHAPLHDGALVIRNLRIYAASCVLPSSTRNGFDFGLMGTRHRAAVGITEVSDALVVVVSEQTGIVSVAQDGKLLRELDEKTLTDILMSYIAGNAYLRYKKANMRKDYLEMMEAVATVKPQDIPNLDNAREEDFEQIQWQFVTSESEATVQKPDTEAEGNATEEVEDI